MFKKDPKVLRKSLAMRVYIFRRSHVPYHDTSEKKHVVTLAKGRYVNLQELEEVFFFRFKR